MSAPDRVSRDGISYGRVPGLDEDGESCAKCGALVALYDAGGRVYPGHFTVEDAEYGVCRCTGIPEDLHEALMASMRKERS